MGNDFTLAVLSVAAGFLFGSGGLYLLTTQKFVRGRSGSIDVTLPLFGRIRTNYPAVVALFAGVFLIWYPQEALNHKESETASPKITISGKMTRGDQPSHAGIMVGVVPGSLVPTDSSGEYTLQVSRTTGSYTGVAFDPGSTSFSPYIRVVAITNDKGKFDHTFGYIGAPRQPSAGQ